MPIEDILSYNKFLSSHIINDLFPLNLNNSIIFLGDNHRSL